MKTKIIYISGNEVFDMADIRAAFDAVRDALNLDKDTVLFGVPVDEDDAGLSADCTPETITESETIKPSIEDTPQETPEIIEETVVETEPENLEAIEPIVDTVEPEIESVESEETVAITPILSVLSSNEENVPEPETVEPETIPEMTVDIDETIDDSIEPDLEKLLSEMAPLNEDAIAENTEPEMVATDEPTTDEEENVDATLEQLATEYIQAQDNITQETKNSGRGKIGKLRNILPFKQSKHKDQGLGDLFGWAGVAANDEEFSVPGFFTNVASKK